MAETEIRWRIKRYRQPWHAIAIALEYVCEWTGHRDGCAMLNRHGGLLSVPYRFIVTREIEWAELAPGKWHRWR